jgi:hypothetical protein
MVRLTVTSGSASAVFEGDVGIGTTNPQVRLDIWSDNTRLAMMSRETITHDSIDGALNSVADLRTDDSSGGLILRTYTDQVSQGSSFFLQSTKASGNSSPAIHLTASNWATSGFVDDNEIVFRVSNNEYDGDVGWSGPIVLMGNGSVGIGTPAPQGHVDFSRRLSNNAKNSLIFHVGNTNVQAGAAYTSNVGARMLSDSRRLAQFTKLPLVYTADSNTTVAGFGFLVARTTTEPSKSHNVFFSFNCPDSGTSSLVIVYFFGDITNVKDNADTLNLYMEDRDGTNSAKVVVQNNLARDDMDITYWIFTAL